MIADWSRPFVLTTPRGSLTFNAASGDRYLLLNDKCAAGADLRATWINLAQADGQFNARQYLTGYPMLLAVGLWVDDGPACGEDAQDMLDTLGLHIDALRNPTGTTRIVWTPEGKAARMLNEIALYQRPAVTVIPQGDAETIVGVTFGVVSTFPHEMSEQEQTPATLLSSTTPTTLTNTGNTPFRPVFRVQGFTTGFEIINADSLDENGDPRKIVYDADRPGALMIGTSDFVEIDCFRGVAYLNGDEDRAFAGIDWEQTDFFALEPGDNDITIVGADADVLWNSAWL